MKTKIKATLMLAIVFPLLPSLGIISTLGVTYDGANIIMESCKAELACISGRIDILDDSIIDCKNTKHFVLADLIGSKEQEIVTFNSLLTLDGHYTNVTMYTYKKHRWDVQTSQLLDLDGFVFKAYNMNLKEHGLRHHRCGSREDVILAGCSLGTNMSTLYMIDYNKQNNSFFYSTLYYSTNLMRDFAVIPELPQILLLENIQYNKTINSTLTVIESSNEIRSFNVETGSCTPIYTDVEMDWKLIVVGNLELNLTSDNLEIILFNGQTGLMMDIQGNKLFEPGSVDFAIDLRDIIIWDANCDGINELIALQSSFIDNETGYLNRIIVLSLSDLNNITIEQIVLNQTKLLKEMDVGLYGRNKEKRLVILDALSATLRILFAFDEEAKSYWFWDLVPAPGVGSVIRPTFYSYFELFWACYGIDTQIVNWAFYDSNDATQTGDELYAELVSKVPSSTRKANFADVVVGLALNSRTDLGDIGRGGGRYSVTFDWGFWTYLVMAHEVGHCLGLVSSSAPNYDTDPTHNPGHCNNILCVMWWQVNPILLANTVMCAECSSRIIMPSRDYTIPIPTISAYPGDGSTTNPGHWTISSSSLPDRCKYEVMIDGDSDGELRVISGGINYDVGVPAVQGMHSISVNIYDWGSNLIGKTSDNTISITSGVNLEEPSLFSDLAFILGFVSIAFVIMYMHFIKKRNPRLTFFTNDFSVI